VVDSDLHPGGGPDEDDEDVLSSCLYDGEALAFCFAYAGPRPTDNRSVVGPPDVPKGDYRG
jgi:hypothetical protein